MPKIIAASGENLIANERFLFFHRNAYKKICASPEQSKIDF
jgi:hypothetical protein